MIEEEFFYMKQPNSDDIYNIKVFITEQNENAIFFEFLDNSLIGGFINSYGNCVPVYSRYLIIAEMCKYKKENPCHMIGRVSDFIDQYSMGEHSPIIIDIMIDSEMGEMDKEDIDKVHKKIKNIKYIKMSLE